MIPRIVTLNSPLEAEQTAPAPEKLLAGDPQQRIWNYYSDASQQFFGGRWSSTPGKWRIRYTETELCVITAGKVELVSEDGTRSAFSQGDAFVVPAGFAGTWEVLEECTKIYAIFESAR